MRFKAGPTRFVFLPLPMEFRFLLKEYAFMDILIRLFLRANYAFMLLLSQGWEIFFFWEKEVTIGFNRSSSKYDLFVG